MRKMQMIVVGLLLIAAVGISGCASTPTSPQTAQGKIVLTGLDLPDGAKAGEAYRILVHYDSSLISGGQIYAQLDSINITFSGKEVKITKENGRFSTQKAGPGTVLVWMKTERSGNYRLGCSVTLIGQSASNTVYKDIVVY